MPLYDGVVTLADNDIPVIVELDEERVRLSASGTEIGDWKTEDCQISLVSDTTYAISAEDDILSFVPNQPVLFAAAVNGGGGNGHRKAEVPLPPDPESQDEVEAEVEPVAADGVREAPPPKPITMGFFYALCALTAGLAVWSLINIVF